MRTLRPALIAVAALTLTACGGGKLYKSDLPPNLKVTTNVEKVTASLGIYAIDNKCRTAYQGSVVLKDKLTSLGIATGKPLYLVTAFSSSSFLGGSSSSTSYELVVTPRHNYRYEMALRYLDGIYNVQIFEIAQKSGKRREIDSQTLPQCNN